MDNFAQNWLTIQCTLIKKCCCALLVMKEPESKLLKPLAQWPPDNKEETAQLLPIAQLALQRMANTITPSILESDRQAFDYLASPIFIGNHFVGVIAVKTTHQPESTQQHIFTILDQGKKWLELSKKEPPTFYASVVHLMAACFEQDNYQQSLIALIAELTRQFRCERVTFGEIKHHHSEIVAFSNTVNFDSKTNFLRAISNAMDESVDQDRIIIYPPTENQHDFVSQAHLELAMKYGASAICSVPLITQNSVFAALTLERKKETPFSYEEVLLLEQSLSLLSPYLNLRHNADRGLLEKVGHYLKNQFCQLLGLNYLGQKISALTIFLCLTTASLLNDDFKIHANAVLEGKVQRVVAAPLQGFILSVNAHAGDTLTKGAVMATLDDTVLKLEAVKLSSQLQQVTREYRKVMSANDLVKISILNAQREQIQAQLQLMNDQLQRTRILAPFDGVVIEGDLSQALGAPVERGDSLFKMAPLEEYRVVLKVNERLISHVQAGQGGMLALSSLPELHLPLTIEKITAVAKAEDGNNIFRVEARLHNHSALLRPGMAGVGKIDAGQKNLLWIWTHELIDWIKLWLWSWWP